MKCYFDCVLEIEIKDGCLPKGSDLPISNAIQQEACGLHDSVDIISINSGWGLSEKGAAAVINESCKKENHISMDEVEFRQKKRLKQADGISFLKNSDSPAISQPKNITKREYFAALAMQGMISNSEYDDVNNSGVCSFAVELADKLLLKLENNDG